MLWVLNLSDGYNALLEIAERADLPFRPFCLPIKARMTLEELRGFHRENRLDAYDDENHIFQEEWTDMVRILEEETNGA